MMKKYIYASLLFFLWGISSQSALAITTTLNIKGNIILPPPCVINGEQTIVVDFTNEVMTTKVDGINYRQPVPYQLDCTKASNNALKMKIVGVDAGFSSALQTKNSDLGIALDSDNNPFPLNTWLNFTRPTAPNLFATLVKRPGTTLKGGAFTAAATMVIDYQ